MPWEGVKEFFRLILLVSTGFFLHIQYVDTKKIETPKTVATAIVAINHVAIGGFDLSSAHTRIQ